jgi:hypothetical protein
MLPVTRVLLWRPRHAPKVMVLQLEIGPNDAVEPVITILMAGEDRYFPASPDAG